MTGKKICMMALGGLMALNMASMAIPSMETRAEAAVQWEHGIQHNDEFNRAIRAENERHEKKMREIREKYHSRSHKDKLQREMRKERERHEARMRELNRKYHHQNPQRSNIPKEHKH